MQIPGIDRSAGLLVRRRRDATTRGGARPLCLVHESAEQSRRAIQIDRLEPEQRVVAEDAARKAERSVAVGIPRGRLRRQAGQVLVPVDRVPMQPAVPHGLDQQSPFESERQKRERLSDGAAARLLRGHLRGRREGERRRRRRGGSRGDAQRRLRHSGSIQGHSGTIYQVGKDDGVRGGGRTYASRPSAVSQNEGADDSDVADDADRAAPKREQNLREERGSGRESVLLGSGQLVQRDSQWQPNWNAKAPDPGVSARFAINGLNGGENTLYFIYILFTFFNFI